MDVYEKALKLHTELKGKIEITPRAKVNSAEALSLAYTPGVAKPCMEIAENPERAYELTRRWNTVAVVSDGSAVLGLGNIGGLAGLPVMEGKCVLFKSFAGVDAFPIVLSGQNEDDIVKTVEMIAPSFGGINLEDIAAPKCFEVERRLKEKLDIPVFHDDQHGTAVVVLAALINTLKLTGKKRESIRVAVSGSGSAGIAIAKLLLNYGIKDVIMYDKKGIIVEGGDLNEAQREMSLITNRGKITGGLKEAVKGADVFIGVSAGKLLTVDMVRSMNAKAAVFAMANPVPEITPEEAKEGGAYVVGTGRSDYPNQINNVLAFPGIFKGAFSVRSKEISEGMKLAAAEAIASLVSDEELKPEYILPGAFDDRVGAAVAAAVAKRAAEEGLNRI